MGTASSISAIWVNARGERPAPCEDPVFVLCAGRSGSTLLRFVLDSHPALACPPETKIPWLCALAAEAWSVVEDAPFGERSGARPVGLNLAGIAPAGAPGRNGGTGSDNSKRNQPMPERVLAGLRRSFDPMIASCLSRTGKRRFCDKSLGSAVHAGLLKQIWPKAKFISLYRHPMDVIGSGIEASPWGLGSYGFENYVARHVGNNVAAIAQYWRDYTGMIATAEQRLGPDCLRVRYEDLVADPEAEAARVFGFIGVEAVPGITQAMFSGQHQRTGPGDHKIWNTSRVGGDSVGRGWDIPARMIPLALIADINGLAGPLGYRLITPEWGKGDRPADVRVPGSVIAD